MEVEREDIAYHTMSPQDVLAFLGSSRLGLSSAEVAVRRRAHGANALPRPRRAGPLRVFARQFAGPLMLVLLVACGIAIALGEMDNALLIAVVIAIHAVLGFLQEFRADRAFARLAAYLPLRAHVVRDATPREVAAHDVVVGDIVLLESGMRVVADARLMSGTLLMVNEAPLTGESAPVAKNAAALARDTRENDRTNMLYAGTTVVAGRGEAVVTAIGSGTAFGRITTLAVTTARERTPLEMQLGIFSRQLVVVILAVVAVVFAWGVSIGVSLADMLVLAIALAVAAIPEGLLVTLTVILAIGMQRMARNHALVRTLTVAETLGSVTVICADKTGTLTTGDMTVTTLVVDHTRVTADDPRAQLLLTTLLQLQTSRLERHEDHTHVSGSLTERALHTFLSPFQEQLTQSSFTVLAELPFASSQKFSARRVTAQGKTRLVALGAPETILARVDCSDAERGMLTTQSEQLSAEGLRVLVVAGGRYEDDTTARRSAVLTATDVVDLQVIGFVGIADPIRPEVVDTIREAAQAGVRTVMVTGDHPHTARAVARALGISRDEESLVTGVELAHLSDEELHARLGTIRVFARITPPDKLRIVRVYQGAGHVVAMTGDGVNDAPALRAADVGIAIGSGTDVAKEAADIVLLDDDFSTIVRAIREGRGLFDNIRKVLVYLMTSSGSELVLICAAIVLGLPMPLLPLHILWINVLSDGLPSIALARERPEPEVMAEAPRLRGEHILRRDMVATTVAAGLVTDGVLVLMLVLFSRHGIDEALIRTCIFVTLGMTSTLYIFALRSFRRPMLRASAFRNRWLYAAVACSMALLFVPVFVPSLRTLFQLAPLPLSVLPILVMLAVVKVLAVEIAKFMLVPRTLALRAHDRLIK